MFHFQNQPTPFFQVSVLKEKHQEGDLLEKTLLAFLEWFGERLATSMSGTPLSQMEKRLETHAHASRSLRLAFHSLLAQWPAKESLGSPFLRGNVASTASVSSSRSESGFRNELWALFEKCTKPFPFVLRLQDTHFLPSSDPSTQEVFELADLLDFLSFVLLSVLEEKLHLSQESLSYLIHCSQTLLPLFFQAFESAKARSLASPNSMPKAASFDFGGLGDLSYSRWFEEARNSFSLLRSQRWLKEHSEEYREQWVALLDGALVASSKTVRELYNRLKHEEKSNPFLLVTQVVF